MLSCHGDRGPINNLTVTYLYLIRPNSGLNLCSFTNKNARQLHIKNGDDILQKVKFAWCKGHKYVIKKHKYVPTLYTRHMYIGVSVLQLTKRVMAPPV